MRTLVVLSVFMTLASAFVLYAINYDTRRIAADVHRQERALEKARQDIAVLKAERAHLSRPERIAPHARALGLQPAKQHQFVDPSRLVETHAQPAGITGGGS